MQARRIAGTIATFALLLARPALAESGLPAQPPVEVLPLAVTPDGLAGPGGERLRGELHDVQFVALGEDHGFAGPPQLAAALARELDRVKGAPLVHAVEVGPIITRQMAALLRREGLAGLDRTIDAQPFAMPFLSNVDDAALALPFARAGRLWGIDQEFIGSAAMLCDLLIARTRDPAVRDRLVRWRDLDHAALRAGRFDQAMMTANDVSTFAALRGSFADDREGLRLLDALIDSARIYQYNSAERYFENNQERARLMLGHFLAQYRAARAPRVLFKMGAYHLGRGITPTSIYDIGSVLPGLAAAQGKRSLHVAFVPLAGKVRAISPTPQGFTAVNGYDDETVARLLAGAGIALDTIPAQGLVLIPLEPVRQRMSGKARRELPEFARFMVLGFDYLVTTRDAVAATHFEAWSPPAAGAERP